MKTFSHLRRRVAFTLIELLVVVAVIGILASLLLPTLAAAKVKARQTKCASNLRQLGLGMLMYADDHGGWLPETTHGQSTNRSWIFTMAPYLGEVHTIRLCPSDPKAQVRLTNHGSSYMMNEYTAVDRIDPFGNIIETFRNLDRLQRPSETITVFTCGDRVNPSIFTDHTHSRNWPKGWDEVLRDIAPDRHRTGHAHPQQLSGGDNYLHADGHVDAVMAAVLKRRFDRGEDIARPPE